MIEWLPILAFIAAAASVLMAIMRLRGDAPSAERVKWLLTIATGLALLTFLVLVFLFIRVKTGYEYVFLYTAADIPLRYRIAGAWAGREGSLLLWALYAVGVAAAVSWWQERDPRDARAKAWMQLVLAVIASAFLAAVAWQDLFAPTSEFFLRNRPDGNGLNPTLLSPFILIHPPVMFLAYALTAVPLAAVVSDLITGQQTWSRLGMAWARVDWLLYTFAMGLGGIWAYYTLGFGGYWAWDPVEVANLLPWLALTVFLHAQLHHRRHGSYRHIGPFLGLLPFLFTIFSTISTRSGLWVSVHAFTDPTDTFDPNAGSRFLEIMAREPSLQFHVGVFLVTLFVVLALWARRLAIDTGHLRRTSQIVAGVLGAAAFASLLDSRAFMGLLLEGADRLPGNLAVGLMVLVGAAVLAPAAPLFIGEEKRKWRLDMQTFALVSVAILGGGLLVIFLWHIAAVNGWSTQSYLGRFPVLATPVLLGLTLFQLHGTHGKRAVWITAGVAIVAGLGAVLAGRTAYLLVLALALVVASANRVIHAGLRKQPRRVRIAGAALWLAAIGNVVFWLNPPSIFGWQPVWPAQLVFGLIAFLGLHLATEVLCGRMRRMQHAHLIVGALGGYGVAPIIAVASWFAHRGAIGVSSPHLRMKQVGLHGAHFAVALVLLGYVTTTYVGSEDTLTLELDAPAELGGSTVTFTGVEQILDGARVERLLPNFHVETGTSTTTADGILYWEPQTGSHFPLPATARLWDRDVYFAVNAVCVDASGECGAGHWLTAYEPSGRLPAGLTITQVEVQVYELPGIALIWASLFLWLYFLTIQMRPWENA